MCKKMYDLAIIGGGPAGLTAALYGLRTNRSVILFEGKALGGTLNQIEKIENYPAFKSISGKKLAEKMVAQVLALHPTVIRQFLLSINRTAEGFALFTSSDEYAASKVIFCTGVKRAPLRAAAVFKGAGISYCAICDGFFYKNRTVVVAGEGYTAQEDVAFLSNICKKVYWICKPDSECASISDGENGSILDKMGNVERIFDTILEVLGTENVEGVSLKSGKILQAEALFVAGGASPDNDLFALVKDKTSEMGEAFGKLGENAFVAGDASCALKQIVTACAQGASAATEIFKPATKQR